MSFLKFIDELTIDSIFKTLTTQPFLSVVVSFLHYLSRFHLKCQGPPKYLQNPHMLKR